MLRTIGHRMRALALVMLGVATLSGCYTMSTTTVYHADGTLDMTMLIAMEESLLEESGQTVDDMIAQVEDELAVTPEVADLVTIEPYAEDGMAGFTMTMTGVTPEQQALMESLETVAYSPESTFVHEDGRIIIAASQTADALAQQEDAQAELESFGMDVADLSAFVDFEVRHTFPGPVEETTIGYIDPEDPNTVVIDDIAATMELTDWRIVASDGTGSSVPVWVWAVGGGVLLALIAGGAVAVLAVGSRRRAQVAPAAAAPSSGMPVGGEQLTSPPVQTFMPEGSAMQQGQPPAPPV